MTNIDANPPPPSVPSDSGAGEDKGSKIKEVFSGLNRKFQEQETQRRAVQSSLPYFNLVGFPIEQSVLHLVPQEQARPAQAVPFFREGSLLRIGAVDLQNQVLNVLVAELQKQRYLVELYLISETSLQSALLQYKKILPVSSSLRREVAVRTSVEMLESLKHLPERGEELSHISASELLNLIIGSAVVLNASDIHLEPEKTAFKVRFRVDGVLQDIVFLPRSLERVLLSRIKLLSGMKLNVTSTPQDGRFTVKLSDRNLDLRVSDLWSAFGEALVLRILGMQDVSLEIEKLGLRAGPLEIVYQELKKPNGLVLTTGPTGSGKTTTLYAFLNHLNRPGVKIITIEDPIEYQLEGIVQTPIDRAAGLDFAKALRSILRQDPDIIMVGEIRDFETAETVCQAALTGHTVFSTLHTNDAAGAIPRFLDLGVKPVTLAPAINALIAQRLVRKICLHCKEIYRPTAAELARVRQSLALIPAGAGVASPERLTFYHSRGCAACHNLGYRGRIGVFEVFRVDDKIESLIFSQASTVDIKKAAVAQGMITMQQDGILKASEGITDLAEVWRVTEE